jgi:hypothetical protein
MSKLLSLSFCVENIISRVYTIYRAQGSIAEENCFSHGQIRDRYQPKTLILPILALLLSPDYS